MCEVSPNGGDGAGMTRPARGVAPHAQLARSTIVKSRATVTNRFGRNAVGMFEHVYIKIVEISQCEVQAKRLIEFTH